jgi:predicted SAM-dependent methyltransferase
MNKKHNYDYQNIIDHAAQLNKRLGRVPYYSMRPFEDALADRKTLHFGSGNTTNPNANHAFFKKHATSITSVDIDPSSGADYKNLSDLINKNHKSSYELIVSEHVFEHIEFKEISRIAEDFKYLLKPGGYVFFTVPNINNFGAWFSNHDHKNFAPPAEIAAIFEIVGFETTTRAGWSKSEHFERHKAFSNTEILLANFLYAEYGLEVYRYISYLLKSNS